MKMIPLSGKYGRGKFALVDDDCPKDILERTWRVDTNGYAVATIRKKIYPTDKETLSMHRIIAGFPDAMVDHINGNKLDNRKCNLRPATNAMNQQNRHKVTSKSGYKGVTRVRGKWQANIVIDGKAHYLGVYKSARQAAKAYDRAVTKQFGEFALTNKMLGLLDD